ncbi:hypothetical protein AB0L82_08090 [Nocardia sp. NPDC052001]|uniref:hypothetical protein n=1 Tax=Nocardia sp. NPDC052001 TaxID=3154853 RepID=UPI0034289FAB
MRRARLRPSVVLTALLAAVLLLVAVAADCTLSHRDGHHHGSTPLAEEAIAPAAFVHLPGEFRSPAAQVVDCGPHQEHCLKVSLPATPEISHSQLMLLIAAALAVLGAARSSGADSGRGPPNPVFSVVSGRMLLTRLCIARR